MKPDENWKETRVLVDDLESLLGIPKKLSEEYLKTIENLIIHRLVEEVSEIEDLRGKDISINLPYLGSLIVSIDEKGRIVTNFSVRSSFYNKIKNACYGLESPLISQSSDILQEILTKKYEDGEDGL